MTTKVKPIPDGYTSVTPYLIFSGASDAIAFYKKAFGATEMFRMPGPDGRIGHAEIKIGNAMIMLADEAPQIGALSVKTIGGSPVSIYLYVDNVDNFVDQAVAAGAKVTRPVADQFYGDRVGGLEDPFGYKWYVGTHVEDVSEEELKKRAAAMAKQA